MKPVVEFEPSARDDLACFDAYLASLSAPIAIPFWRITSSSPGSIASASRGGRSAPSRSATTHC